MRNKRSWHDIASALRGLFELAFYKQAVALGTNRGRISRANVEIFQNFVACWWNGNQARLPEINREGLRDRRTCPGIAVLLRVYVRWLPDPSTNPALWTLFRFIFVQMTKDKQLRKWRRWIKTPEWARGTSKKRLLTRLSLSVCPNKHERQFPWIHLPGNYSSSSLSPLYF